MTNDSKFKNWTWVKYRLKIGENPDIFNSKLKDFFIHN